MRGIVLWQHIHVLFVCCSIKWSRKYNSAPVKDQSLVTASCTTHRNGHDCSVLTSHSTSVLPGRKVQMKRTLASSGKNWGRCGHICRTKLCTRHQSQAQLHSWTHCRMPQCSPLRILFPSISFSLLYTVGFRSRSRSRAFLRISSREYSWRRTPFSNTVTSRSSSGFPMPLSTVSIKPLEFLRRESRPRFDPLEGSVTGCLNTSIPLPFVST